MLGACAHRKELFYYGSGFGNLFTAGLSALHGPRVPLELFQSREVRPRGVTGSEWDAMRLARMEAFCTSSEHTMLPDGRMHPACCVAEASNPKRWGCRWHEQLRRKHHRKRSMWFQNAMPWVVPAQYDFATVDFTPNYLCTEKAREAAIPAPSPSPRTPSPHPGPEAQPAPRPAQALKNIHSSARDPKELRFIVLMRDPIMRAFSEWSMFVLGWG